MNSHWIVRAPNNPDLLLFFNGWGMDHRIVAHLRVEPGADVLMLFGYDDLTVKDEVARAINAYRRVDVLAWSMGVWAYAALHAQFAGRVRAAVALNGTPRPIDDAYGIPHAVYAATVRQFSATGRQKFFRRMCGDAETLRWFLARQPQRSLDEQRAELIAIRRAAAQLPQCAVPPFTRALIGRRDKIMPAQRQLQYWQGTVDHALIDAPHCAFQRWNSWKEIFDHVTPH